MKIWKLISGDDSHISLKLSTSSEKDFEFLNNSFNGQPINPNNWPEVEVYTLYKSKKVSDCAHCWDLTGSIILSNKAVNILNDLISDCVEILPIKHSHLKLFACNVTNLVDCLSVEDSKVKTLSSGKIIRIDNPVLKKSEITNKHIFKIPQEKWRDAYVSDDFKKLVEINKLKGFIFKEVDLI